MLCFLSFFGGPTNYVIFYKCHQFQIERILQPSQHPMFCNIEQPYFLSQPSLHHHQHHAYDAGPPPPPLTTSRPPPSSRDESVRPQAAPGATPHLSPCDKDQHTIMEITNLSYKPEIAESYKPYLPGTLTQLYPQTSYSEVIMYVKRNNITYNL